MIIDMHLHTVASGDSLITAEDLIDQALAIGLDGICVTEHDSYAASADVAELAYGTALKVFRGVEVSAREGHLLLYGVTDDSWRDHWLAHDRNTQRLIDYVRAQGGVVVPAHPFDPVLPGVGDALLSLAGVFALEGFNGRIEAYENLRTQERAAELNLQLLGGSDAHLLPDIGRCVTEFSAPSGQLNTVADLVTELKAGRFQGRYL